MKGSLHVSTLVYVPLVPTSKFNACTHTLTTYRMYIDTNPIVLLLFTPEMALGRGKSHNTGNSSQYLYSTYILHLLPLIRRSQRRINQS